MRTRVPPSRRTCTCAATGGVMHGIAARGGLETPQPDGGRDEKAGEDPQEEKGDPHLPTSGMGPSGPGRDRRPQQDAGRVEVANPAQLPCGSQGHEAFSLRRHARPCTPIRAVHQRRPESARPIAFGVPDVRRRPFGSPGAPPGPDDGAVGVGRRRGRGTPGVLTPELRSGDRRVGVGGARGPHPVRGQAAHPLGAAGGGTLCLPRTCVRALYPRTRLLTLLSTMRFRVRHAVAAGETVGA